MNHTNCSHPATSAARAACRKALAADPKLADLTRECGSHHPGCHTMAGVIGEKAA